MAPKLYYKNIGGISYKADVYSFEMLLMEMADRRKNLNAFAKHSSQIYFLTWVYEQLHQGNNVEMKGSTEEEKKIGKKMIDVALWCIQMKPTHHHSMNKRKNLNTFAKHSSQIYFFTWVYKQLHQGNDVEMEGSIEEEKKIGKKIIDVALWCIQMMLTHRHSMNKVVQMLE